jgi:hypothetical protein
MKKFIVLLSAVALSACCSVAGRSGVGLPSTPSDIACINKDEFNGKLRAALDDDLGALYELRMHYLGCESDEQTGLAFMEREAMLGDADARQELIDIYGSRPQYRDRLAELRQQWSKQQNVRD